MVRYTVTLKLGLFFSTLAGREGGREGERERWEGSTTTFMFLKNPSH